MFFLKINLRAETDLQSYHLYDSLQDAPGSARQAETSALLAGSIWDSLNYNFINQIALFLKCFYIGI